ncbi:MAG: hypothetical protein RL217_490 [Pseudomonadota bacterium]|jgi:UDP-N-acetylglucosamine acyltransferase
MIHATAIIDPSAKIASDVEIGPYSIIGAQVEIGSGTVVGPHVVIKGPTVIGKNNRIFQFASVGEDCQDKKYAGEPTRLVIGDNNVIRESCTIHRGTAQDKGVTSVGSGNLFMVNVHIAHDVVVGDNCIIANNTNIAGHVSIGDYAILGGASQVHQFCNIGAHSMCGGGSVVLKDVPAYVMAQGYPAVPHGINTEGLKRRGFSPEAVSALRNAYKILYRQGHTMVEAHVKLTEMAQEFPEVNLLIASLDIAARGIIR